MGYLRQVGKGQRLLQMPVDMLEHPVHAGVVAGTVVLGIHVSCVPRRLRRARYFFMFLSFTKS